MYKNTHKFGISTAIISFVIGSLFLLNFLISKDFNVGLMGYFYLVCAFIINLIIAIYFLYKALIHKEKRKKYFKTIFIMLINIPIAFIYFLIVTQFI